MRKYVCKTFNNNNAIGSIEKTGALLTHHNNQHPHKMSASTASSSAASTAAAINDSKDNGREQVSDVVNDTINDNDDNMSNNDVSNDEDKETEAEVFFRDAQKTMNWTSLKIGTATMEDCRFRSFFGARQDIVKMVWDMLGKRFLHPKKSKPKHLLWALYFLKVYLSEGPGCSAVGGSKGAINPKTMQKWVLLFLERIAELANNVVSDLTSSYHRPLLPCLVALSIISNQTTDCF
jgi:hypothetical protein